MCCKVGRIPPCRVVAERWSVAGIRYLRPAVRSLATDHGGVEARYGGLCPVLVPVAPVASLVDDWAIESIVECYSNTPWRHDSSLDTTQ